jgi:hemoglobin
MLPDTAEPCQLPLLFMSTAAVAGGKSPKIDYSHNGGTHNLTGEHMNTQNKTLYERLGGYDAIAAVVDSLLPRLESDAQLGRFWANRGDDGIAREKQLLIDYLCASAGGPTLYTGRDMPTSHKGMGISDTDWKIFIEHIKATLASFQVPQQEQDDVLGFIESTKAGIVE